MRLFTIAQVPTWFPSKGCLSQKTGLAMAFKLMMLAQVKWRKLDGENRLPEIVQGITFKDGIKQLQATA